MVMEKLDFTFVQDQRLREVLEDYYSQGVKAYEVGSYLGTLVACGSVVEGLLTWALLQHKNAALNSSKADKNKQGQVRPLEEWNLTYLINVSAELKLIGKTANQASWAVKDFRNFIHPYNLLKQSARPDRSLAMSALGSVGEINRSLKGRLSKCAQIQTNTR